MKLIVVDGVGTDPIRNLALEEFLTETVDDDEVILYLWQNANTVVIGRHQNPWQECHMQKIEEDSVSLVRRLSGGGAVYHDLGNLNFTFITTDKLYDVHRQLSVIIEAVQGLGITAQFSGRNDILAEGKKFSGNAFYRTKNKRYHHGTLLVDVDKEKMGRYLNVTLPKLQGNGVKSVKSRVVNLKEFNGSMTIPRLKESIISAAEKIYGTKGMKKDGHGLKEEVIAKKMDRFSDEVWTMGRGVTGGYQKEHRFDWGQLRCHWKYNQDRSRIDACILYSDAMDEGWIYNIMEAMNGISLEKGVIYETVMGIGRVEYSAGGDEGDKKSQSHELASWLEEIIEASK